MNTQSLNQGIYAIRHVDSGKMYIGSTVNLTGRWAEHKLRLKKARHPNKHLQSAWGKYGLDSFEFSVIEFVDDPKNLITREQTWLEFFQAYDKNKGYNASPTAGRVLGVKHTEEVKDKKRGNNYGKGNKGKVRTAAMNVAASLLRRGRFMPEATKQSLKNANTGRICSEITRSLIGAAHRGRPMHPNSKLALLKANIGRPVSEDLREKRRIRMTGNTFAKGIMLHKPNLFSAKLKPEQVRNMKDLYESGVDERGRKWTYQRIADLFGVSIATAHNNMAGKILSTVHCQLSH